MACICQNLEIYDERINENRVSSNYLCKLYTYLYKKNPDKWKMDDDSVGNIIRILFCMLAELIDRNIK